MKDDKTLQNIEKYQKHYSEPKLFAKISRIFRKAGIKGVYYALLLYHVVTDPGTPARQKAIILGALGYFILPMDMIPDLMPLVGFTDDIAALTACLKAVYDNVTPSVKSKAAHKLLDWFPDADISRLEDK